MQDHDKKYIDSLFSFLSKGVSPYHVVKETEQMLNEAGFQPLDIHTSWKLEQSGCYYCKP